MRIDRTLGMNRLPAIPGAGRLSMRGTHLGEVHMDALGDEQPNLIDVNTYMSVSGDSGESKPQEPAAPPSSSVPLRGKFVLHKEIR